MIETPTRPAIDPPSWELVTPETAIDLLLRNPHNRRMTATRRQQMARDMVNGDWYPEAGAMIIVADNGELLNGQKTLSAIVDSDRAQWVLVLRDVPVEMWAYMDLTQPRRFSQELQREGFEHSTTFAAAVKVEWEMREEKPVGGREMPSMAVSKHLWETLEGAFMSHVTDANRISRRIDFGTPSALLAVMARAYGYDLEAAAQFFAELEHGNPRVVGDNRTHIERFLGWLEEDNRRVRGSRRGPDNTMRSAWLIDTINATWTGSPRLTRWKPGVPYPRLQPPQEAAVTAE